MSATAPGQAARCPVCGQTPLCRGCYAEWLDALAAQEPHAAPAFDRDAAIAAIEEHLAASTPREPDTAEQLERPAPRLAAEQEPHAADGDGELRDRLTALAVEHDRTAEAYQKSIPPTDPGSADGFRKQAAADAWRSSAAGIRDALRLAAAQQPQPAPELAAQEPHAADEAAMHRERLRMLLADTPFEFRPDWTAEYLEDGQ